VESNRGGLYRGVHNLLLFVSKGIMDTVVLYTSLKTDTSKRLFNSFNHMSV
jgi:hypothetical protein